MKSLLEKHGLSKTASRIGMLEVLKKEGHPLTIDQIQEKMQKKVSPSTLYRSLKVLVDAGIVYQTDFRDGAAYFEFQGDAHHHHITCTSCKKQEEVPICFESGMMEVQEQSSFTITSHVIEFFGLCENCS